MLYIKSFVITAATGSLCSSKSSSVTTVYDTPSTATSFKQADAGSISQESGQIPWIASEYATFGIKVVKIIEKKKSVDEVHMWLSLKYSKKDSKSGGSYMFHRLGLKNASQPIRRLLTRLIQETSWYDYDQLASIAIELGEDEGRKLVDDYNFKLNWYQQGHAQKELVENELHMLLDTAAQNQSLVISHPVQSQSPTLQVQVPKVLVTPKGSPRLRVSPGLASPPSPRRSSTPTNTTSFSDLVLSRASKQCPANLRMVAIRCYNKGKITIVPEEHLVAVYQRNNKTFVLNKQGDSESIPSNCCFISASYQNDQSKAHIVNRSYKTDLHHKEGTLPIIREYKPLRAMVIQKYIARHPTELTLHKNDVLYVLFHEHQWVYGTTGGDDKRSGFVPESYITYCEHIHTL